MNGLRLSKVPSTPWTSRPPLGADGIGVAEMRKSLRQRRLAVHGDRMTGDRPRRTPRERHDDRRRGRERSRPRAATSGGLSEDAVTANSAPARSTKQPTQQGLRRSATLGRSKRFQKPTGCVITSHSPTVLTRLSGEIPAIRATSWRHAVAVFGADTAPNGGDRSIRPARAVGNGKEEDRPCSSGSCLRRPVRLPTHLHLH